MIRIGIEGKRLPILNRIRSLALPVLVSANSIWNDDKQQFGLVWRNYAGLDVALDSGGFVAMKRYGRYRFSPEQYAALARDMQPTWWAQMDFCCEPEVASNRAEVTKRINRTAEHLRLCRTQAVAFGISEPLIVLQGWKPEDYVSGPAWDGGFEWPNLVGVGSVCRRHLHGDNGLLKVIGVLDRKLPPHVRLHLFGVKGIALRYLASHPRFASMDSMAWNMEARHNARRAGVPASNEFRAANIEPWLNRQTPKESQCHFGI